MPSENNSVPKATWVVCQIGAREHYAIARGLHAESRLKQLITDLWISPGFPLLQIPANSTRRLQGRYHPDLAELTPLAPNVRSIVRESVSRIRPSANRSPWQNTISRNDWFAGYCGKMLRKLHETTDQQLTVFAYSYAALSVFRVARELGHKTVLGQIDAGLGHQHIVEAAYAANPEWGSPQLPPKCYWDNWQEECRLADRIIVNSKYSQEKIINDGHVDSSKTEVIPVAYESSAHDIPDPLVKAFSHQSPMRVLMIGRATLEKGMGVLLEASKLLVGFPIIFDIVGSAHSVPANLRNGENLRWHGHVPRSDVHKYYSQASVMVFPTLSDGFGLTQLEAQNRGLPVIASSNCGDVVTNNLNGIVLQHNTAEELSHTLRRCCEEPDLLKSWSQNSGCPDIYSLHKVTKQLTNAA